MSEVDTLLLFKEDALERLADNERFIEGQKKRIDELEFHLGKCRDSAYQMCYATVGVLPMDFVPDEKPKKPKKEKSCSSK